jgi:hypothetical protein
MMSDMKANLIIYVRVHSYHGYICDSSISSFPIHLHDLALVYVLLDSGIDHNRPCEGLPVLIWGLF